MSDETISSQNDAPPLARWKSPELTFHGIEIVENGGSTINLQDSEFNCSS